VAEILETRQTRGLVQGPYVLDASLDLERFGEAFDAVQTGRPNGFSRHDSSPGS
jgi:hypothetical protein